MYARRVADRELTFDFAAGLRSDNLLLVDRETESVWSQLEGKAIAGPLEGAPVEMIPTLQTTWSHWRSLHPDTRVMVLEGEGRPYRYRTWVPGTPRPEKPPEEHDLDLLGLGLALGGEARFFPLRELDWLDPSRLPLDVELGGRSVRVHYDEEGMTAWAEDPGGDLFPGVLAYEWGWKRFFPETETFSARPSE